MEWNVASQTLNILNFLLKNPVTVDVETSTTNKGNPHTAKNKCVTIQVKEAGAAVEVYTKENFHLVTPILLRASCLVGFNLKFDLAWLERELGFKATCVWDCQLAEFIFSNQTWKYPNLNDTLLKYGFEPKIDKVKEMWDQGYDTDQIPLDILAEYGAYDVNGTYNVFLEQVKLFETTREHQLRLFRLHCNDLIVLQEMETNGILYDVNSSVAMSQQLQKQIDKLEGQLSEFTNNIPINFDSRDHMSIFLYGGSIKTETRLPCGVYKSGDKVGQTRYKIIRNEYPMPRILEPPKGSALKKDGYFSTDEDTLLSIKTDKLGKQIISKVLERSKLCKLRSTYLDGLPKTIREMDWPNDTLFSNLNQCTAVTGRLSSTKPNQQNLPGEAKMFCVSRY